MAAHPDFAFEVIYEDTLCNLDDTLSSKQHCVSICNDYEDGEWRRGEFIKFVMDNLVETALSYEERQKMISNPFSALCHAVPRLRVVEKDKGKGGEIAEICLYGIMRKYFNDLPVVPKIFHKQNPKDNAKGADSVHIKLDDDDSFTLWFGEAKFYNSIDPSRLDDPVQSVLNAIEKTSLRKENSIIMGLKDLDGLIENKSTLETIKRTLELQTSIDKIKQILHIPILLLYQCDITKKATTLSDEVKNKIIEFHKQSAIEYFKKLNHKQEENVVYNFDKINFHLILFPVHDKGDIVDNFYKQIQLFLTI